MTVEELYNLCKKNNLEKEELVVSKGLNLGDFYELNSSDIVVVTSLYPKEIKIVLVTE